LRHDGILRRVRVTGYDRKKLFVMFLIVMTTLTIDLSISSVADIVSKQAVTFWGIVIFTIIAGIFIVGQFFILYMIKAKNNESKLKSANIIRLEKTVTIVQYVLTAIMVFVVLQIAVISQYYIHLLTAAVTVSYGLATFLLGLLAYRLFSWFRINKSLVVLIYGLAVAAIAINAIDSLVFFDVVLLGKPSMVLPQSQVIFQVGFTPGRPN
jgi:hypothetical protein